ncbi:MAG: hypothetical protein JOY93_11125 [Acidobacteriales bacterium]|nr:hypothetical protein [Terriglobales bacterium]
MRVEINLASRVYEDAGRFWLRWGSAVAALGILTLVLAYFAVAGWLTARKDRDLIRQSQQQIQLRDQERARAEVLLNLPQNSSTRDRSQFLNDLFQRKAFSWTRVFEDLERVMPPRLHVVSIHPEMAANNQLAIKLVVAGDTRERAQELVRKMEESPRFHETAIDQEMEAPSTTTGDRVMFDISALYVPELEPTSTQEAR